MTAPTHIAFGSMVAYAASSDVDWCILIACAIGSVLPDIDHPRSAVGRVANLFWNLSGRINKRWDHRKEVHGRPLWGALLLLTFLVPWEWTKWVFIGALLHCYIDQLNTMGVEGWQPYTDKVLVLFKREWRFRNGHAGEYILLAVFVLIIAFTYNIRERGGIRVFANEISGAHDITVQNYEKAGNLKCHVEGEFRFADGRKATVNWLIVGTEKQELVCWDGENLIRKRDGQFLSSTIIQSKEEWKAVQVAGIAYMAEPTFFFSGKLWHYAKPGTPVLGWVKVAPERIE